MAYLVVSVLVFPNKLIKSKCAISNIIVWGITDSDCVMEGALS